MFPFTLLNISNMHRSTASSFAPSTLGRNFEHVNFLLPVPSLDIPFSGTFITRSNCEHQGDPKSVFDGQEQTIRTILIRGQQSAEATTFNLRSIVCRNVIWDAHSPLQVADRLGTHEVACE